MKNYESFCGFMRKIDLLRKMLGICGNFSVFEEMTREKGWGTSKYLWKILCYLGKITREKISAF